MKKISILILTVMFSVAVMAQNADERFEQANEAYNEGLYDQALTGYSAIETEGLESSVLFYNMGNTYYKMKDYPHAILYYEKALKLDPSDEDTRVNLEIANLAVVDKINPIPQSFLKRWWNSLRAAFPADGWAWLGVALFALLLACLFVFLMSRRTGLRKAGFFVGLVALVCLAFSVVFAIESQRRLTRQNEAIVMTPTVTVKSSPSTESVDLFVLHEGTKVWILDSARDRNKIRIADGSVGWLPVGDVTQF